MRTIIQYVSDSITSKEQEDFAGTVILPSCRCWKQLVHMH